MERVQSVITIGNDGLLVEAECQLSNGLPIIILVGLGTKAVDESKERIRGAFVSSGIKLPRKRITINLAPADVPKDSTSLDMTIAAAILASEQQKKFYTDEKTAFMGEIGLDGKFRPIRGIIGKLITGKKLGIETFIIPTNNYAQAKLVPNVRLIPLDNLNELQNLIVGGLVSEKVITEAVVPRNAVKKDALSLVVGQKQTKRALEIAAAGGHNVFF